jgi:NAD(P)-dependent dehydrogenase (short-subunit alcohol dehydrogenase family)
MQVAYGDDMPERLQGRVVLITGAASGIGRATALRAVAEGASVGALDRDADGLRQTVAQTETPGGRVVPAFVDVADIRALAAAISRLAGELGPIDGVFANAGILPSPTPVSSLDSAQWDRVLAVNLTGAVMTLTSSLPHVRDGASLILNGSSLAIRPREGRLAYVAAKAGVHAAGRALALELAPRRIRVNVIAPGLTDTAMVHAIPGHVETGLPSVPLADLVPPDEVAALAVHLWSDDSAHLTGAVVSIDGGRTAG